MKLNNKGWGTMEMLLLSGGLLLALIISIYFIANLYGSFSGTVGNKSYMDLEIELEKAAREYIKSNRIEINGELKLDYKVLKAQNFIDNLQDIDGKDCDGYVKIYSDDNSTHYAGFISCNKYKTTNY